MEIFVLVKTDLEDCSFNHESAQAFAVILYLLSIIVLVKEGFQMKKNSSYFRDVTNYAQLLIVLISFTNSAPAWQSSSEVDKWQSYLAAVGFIISHHDHFLNNMKILNVFLTYLRMLREWVLFFYSLVYLWRGF